LSAALLKSLYMCSTITCTPAACISSIM
jgi:hypothetical protein